MRLLEVNELTTEFHTASGVVRAVDGVNFHVNEGEIVALVGESGCGKSATAQSIMRLIPSPPRATVSGQVIFNGEDVLTMGKRRLRQLRGRDVAMVFQDPMSSLNPVLPIGRQLTESLRLHKQMRGMQAKRRAVELLDMVGIPAAASRLGAYPHQFSGGMRQRVMIAMALSCEPKLILADEITTALDVTIQAQILELLKDLTQALDTAVIFITHDLGVVAGVANRVNVMYAGRIVEQANTADLFSQPAMPYTWSLLTSVPRLDQPRSAKLQTVSGQPPDLTALPSGCRFRPRCAFHRSICEEQEPPLSPVAEGSIQRVRCWGMADTPEGGWLRDHHWMDHSVASDWGETQ